MFNSYVKLTEGKWVIFHCHVSLLVFWETLVTGLSKDPRFWFFPHVCLFFAINPRVDVVMFANFLLFWSFSITVSPLPGNLRTGWTGWSSFLCRTWDVFPKGPSNTSEHDDTPLLVGGLEHQFYFSIHWEYDIPSRLS